MNECKEKYILPKTDILLEKSDSNLEYLEDITKKIKKFGREIEIIDINIIPTSVRYVITSSKLVNVVRFVKEIEELEYILCVGHIEVNILKSQAKTLEIIFNNPKKNDISLDKFIMSKSLKKLDVFLGLYDNGTNACIDLRKYNSIVITSLNDIKTFNCLNTMLISLILKHTPNDLELILMDTKVTEFLDYDNLPHISSKIISNYKVIDTLIDIVNYMDSILTKINEKGYNDIKEYNKNENNKIKEIVVVLNDMDLLIYENSDMLYNLLGIITTNGKKLGVYIICSLNYINSDKFIRSSFYENSILVSLDYFNNENNQYKDFIKGAGYIWNRYNKKIIRFSPAIISLDQSRRIIEYWKNL